MARRALSALGVLDLAVRLASAQAAPPYAGADAAAGVRVRFRDCVPARFAEGAVEQAVALELEGRRSIESTGRAPTVEVDLIVACAAESLVLAVATELGSGASVARRVPLDDVSQADRPRVVGLALGELLEGFGSRDASARSELQTPASSEAVTPPIEAPAPTTALEARRDAPRARPRSAITAATPEARDRVTPAPVDAARAHRVGLVAAAKARWLWAPDTRLLGASLGVGSGALGVGVEALFGSATIPLGEASFGLAALVASYAPLAFDVGALRARTGVALGLGLTWVNSTTESFGVNQHSALRGYVDLRATQAFELALGARLRALAGVELGRSSGVQAYADDRAIGATGGWFVAAGVGARY